jgi:hypothetical protein
MKNTTLVMCVVAALAVFTSSVKAESATREARIDNELQIAGCNVNGWVELSGKVTLSTNFILASNRLYVDAEVRPDALAATSATYPTLVSGVTQVSQRIVYFTNGLATLTFPCSFKVERARTINSQGTIRFEIQYTAHLTFIQRGVQVSLEGASYDNFQFVCL